MKRLFVNLQNCYGIKKLTHTFDFKDGKPYSIYAPNGFMKTSFSKTFFDLQSGKGSKDLVFESRTTVRDIKINGAAEPDAESIFVIEPYNEAFSSEKTSALLVNKALKRKYDDSIKQIEEKNDVITKKLKQLSGLTGRSVTPEIEIEKCFELNGKNLYDFYEEIVASLTGKERFSHITYSEVFNAKTLSLLNSGAIKSQLQEYIEKYHELVDNSPMLSKKFNHHSASVVTKNLTDNGFFEANHSVNLFDGKDKAEVTDSNDLSNRFSKEKERIFNDESLVKTFEAVDKKLSNVELRKFRDYLFDNKELLPELIDYQSLQKEIWCSYFTSIKDSLDDFVITYGAAKKTIKLVVEQAKKEETEWKKVVKIFNLRFSVPFILKVENQGDVILKGESPHIAFEFEDSSGSNRIPRNELLSILSQGEKRALYILNLLFEINVRQNRGIQTLFIVDDIADSFDYKNKYSIVEYFKEIASASHFNVIFLTHNFDFHRTIGSRLGIPRIKRLFVSKNDLGLTLSQEKYQKNPFSWWKKNLETNPRFLVASIPFVRNLAEYCGSQSDSDYLTLTSLLHEKADSAAITVSDLEGVYRRILTDKPNLTLQDQTKSVIKLIDEVATGIAQENSETVDLECKVILSIAIRLAAENFMKRKIADTAFFTAITKDQTFMLFERFSKDYPSETEALAILDQVNLMTPENIHLNSFMYEPILDMSAIHLYRLYDEVKKLTP